MNNEALYAAILRGGHVIDPANHIDGIADVAVKDGKIAVVAKNIAANAVQNIDVSGCYVTPGLIDMHCHCYPFFPFAHDSLPTINPDAHMLQNGVTTAVDAGTCGVDDFPAFLHEIIEKSTVNVLAFINIAKGGMVHMDTEQTPACFTVDAAADIAKSCDKVVGIKSAHYWVGRAFDDAHPAWASIDAAVQAGEKCGKPCMLDFQPTLPERSYQRVLFEHLRPGDIHTHMYAQQFPVLDGSGKVNDFLFAARERGIKFDLGHGAGSFMLRNAVPSVQQGFVPDTISTDLYLDNIAGPVIGLLHVMSKFLAMDMPVQDIISRVTARPAAVLGHTELGTLSVGACADIAVLTIENGQYRFADSGRFAINGHRRFACQATLRQGRLIYNPNSLTLPDWQSSAQ